ncbi:MAG: PIN domain-containing protein [Planctomycetota bacterium]|nr:PIN domain-containing protein [Planctomycetota bacterium]
MTVGLDTSVVLRLLLKQPVEQSQRAVAFLEAVARRGDQAVISDLVVAETYFALQYHYAVPKKAALAALRQMFADGEIASQGIAAAVLDAEGLASAKPGFVDRLIHGAYVAAGGSMATFEKAAGKLKSVRVL